EYSRSEALQLSASPLMRSGDAKVLEADWATVSGALSLDLLFLLGYPSHRCEPPLPVLSAGVRHACHEVKAATGRFPGGRTHGHRLGRRWAVCPLSDGEERLGHAGRAAGHWPALADPAAANRLRRPQRP